MFEYGNSAHTNQQGSPISRIAGFLLFLCVLLRIFATFFDTEKAFWACFLVWDVLSLIEYLSSRKAEKSADAKVSRARGSQGETPLPISWKAFGPLMAFNLITIFLGLWPLGGLGILFWMISWVVYDFIESSRFSRRGLTTLSLR